MTFRAPLISAVTAFAVWLAAGTSVAQAAGTGVLTPRLARLATPALRSASAAAQDAAVGLSANGTVHLERSGRRVSVDIRFADGASSAVPALKAAGASVLDASDRYETVEALVAPADLDAVAAVAGVRSVRELLTPVGKAAGSGARRSTKADLAGCHGATTTEGDTQLHAADARAAMNLDGAGVTVGVVSDSFDQSTETADHASDDVASGDLPGVGNPCGHLTPVDVIHPDTDPDATDEDEGRAMLQIVHDIAPGAALVFSNFGPGDDVSFADRIRALHDAGARAIADDISLSTEPFFQDGPESVAVDEVASEGTTLFAATGNDNLLDADGHDIASWESPAFQSTACPAAIGGTGCENFDPGGTHASATCGAPSGTLATQPADEYCLSVDSGGDADIDFQWAEPWYGVTSDFDIYLLHPDGTQVMDDGFPVDSTDDNLTTQLPYEEFDWTNESSDAQPVELVIKRRSGTAAPRIKFFVHDNGFGVSQAEYPVSDPSRGIVVGPAIWGHEGAAAASSVAAIGYDASTPEDYSSHGPEVNYFGPVLDATPAAPLATPQVVNKPDVTATDGGVTTFFGDGPAPPFRFFGTSAAAPHAAGVAALQLEANPRLTPAQVIAAQDSTATPIPGFGRLEVGGGLLDAVPAVEGPALPPVLTVLSGPAARSNDTTPTFAFAANRSVTSTCSIDGHAQPCQSPFTAGALADGSHTFSVSGVDAAGHTGATGTVSFAIDTTAPHVQPSPSPVTHDTIAPRLAGLAASPGRFFTHAVRSRKATKHHRAVKGHRAGTELTFTVSEAVTAKLSIARLIAGRKVGRTGRTVCAKPSRAHRTGAACTLVHALGTLASIFVPRAGRVSVRLSGKLHGTALAPGTYRVTLNAADRAGNRAKPATLRVRILA